MRAHLLGCRGSTPATGPAHVRYGGETSCVALAPPDGDPCLLLDLGTGARHLVGLVRAFRGHAFVSHLHWDHTHGIPFARALDHPSSRVAVHIPEQGAPAADVMARALGPPHFPITPTGLQGTWTFDGLEEGTTVVPFGDGEAHVTARDIPHKGGRTFGYRVETATGSLAYLPDHHPGGLGPGPNGIGELHPAALALADGADLLLHDAQYTRAEYPARADWGHSVMDYAVALGVAAAVGTVVLFHHDPDRSDDDLDAVAARWADHEPRVVVARQGDVLDTATVSRAAATVAAELG